MSEVKARTMKLQCPSAWKTVEMVVWDDERVDLGSIARALGLDPPTVRLNGRFITTGLGFVALSVTWKSLLSFFASKGLSAQDVVVHGKLSKVGTKRACESWESENGAFSVNSGSSTEEYNDMVKNRKKMRNGNSGESATIHEGLGIKRNQLLEELSLLKRLRINETCAGDLAKGNNAVADHTGLSSDISAKANNGVSKAISSTSFRCSPNKVTKRTREGNVEEAVLAAPCKRMR